MDVTIFKFAGVRFLSTTRKLYLKISPFACNRPHQIGRVYGRCSSISTNKRKGPCKRMGLSFYRQSWESNHKVVRFSAKPKERANVATMFSLSETLSVGMVLAKRNYTSSCKRRSLSKYVRICT
jgi:hypothetical protein